MSCGRFVGERIVKTLIPELLLVFFYWHNKIMWFLYMGTCKIIQCISITAVHPFQSTTKKTHLWKQLMMSFTEQIVMSLRNPCYLITRFRLLSPGGGGGGLRICKKLQKSHGKYDTKLKGVLNNLGGGMLRRFRSDLTWNRLEWTDLCRSCLWMSSLWWSSLFFIPVLEMAVLKIYR